MNNDFCSHGRTEASCLECKDKRIADLEYEKQVQSMAIYERNSDNERLRAELAQAKAESACPCCKNGTSIDGKPCQECHGSGKLSVAYDTVRGHYKQADEERDTLRAENERLTNTLAIERDAFQDMEKQRDAAREQLERLTAPTDNDPLRYSFMWDSDQKSSGMFPFPSGEWISWLDYCALRERMSRPVTDEEWLELVAMTTATKDDVDAILAARARQQEETDGKKKIG